MEPVDYSKHADQPQQNSCHQTGSWSAVQHTSVYQPIADVNRLPPPTDIRRIGMAMPDRIEPCIRENGQLKSIRRTGSKWGCRNVLTPSSLAAAFCSDCRRWKRFSVMPLSIQRCSNPADWRRMPGSPSLWNPPTMRASWVEFAQLVNW